MTRAIAWATPRVACFCAVLAGFAGSAAQGRNAGPISIGHDAPVLAVASVPPGRPGAEPASDFAAPAGGIVFGRALDIEGSPVRLVNSAGRPGWAGGGASSYTGPFAMPSGSPLRHAAISSRFGSRWHPLLGGARFHAGLDMAAPTGSPVYATSPGAVLTAGWCGGYGLCVTVDHGKGYVTLYGHLSAVMVQENQVIPAGQAIGRVGSTGRSTGPHLHYEIRKDGQPLDPLRHL